MSKLISAACVVAGTLIGACADGYVDHNPEPGSLRAAFHRDIHFDADPSFSAEELEQLAQAASHWQVWSSGKLRITVLSAVSVGGDPSIRKLAEDDPFTVEHDKEQQAKFGKPNVKILGYTDDDGNISLVTARMKTADLHTYVEHEMGHSAKMQWPNCGTETRAPVIGGVHDCTHVSDPPAIMYPTGWPGKTFQPSDLAFCQANCLCP